MRFRKKPRVVDAVQYTGSNNAEIADFMRSSPRFCSDADGKNWVEIDTLEGTMRADPGDWIIRGVEGELYPCKPAIFEQTYEAA